MRMSGGAEERAKESEPVSGEAVDEDVEPRWTSMSLRSLARRRLRRKREVRRAGILVREGRSRQDRAGGGEGKGGDARAEEDRHVDDVLRAATT